MGQIDSIYNAGSSPVIQFSELDFDGSLITSNAATITITGNMLIKLVDAAAMSESVACPGVMYYAWTTPASGVYTAVATFTSGVQAVLVFQVGTGEAALESTNLAIKAKTDILVNSDLTYLDAAVSSRLAAADYTSPPDISGLAVETTVQAIKLLTDKLAAMIENTGVHDRFKETALETVSVDLTGVATSTEIAALHDFNPALETVTVYNTNDCKADLTQVLSDLTSILSRLTSNRAGYLDNLNNPGLFKADVSSLATSIQIAALNNLTAQQVWEYVTRTLTSAQSGTTPEQVWAYATRTLTDPNSYKADVSALALQTTALAVKAKTDNLPSDPASQSGEFDIGSVKGTSVSGIADFRAVISGLATSAEIAALNDLALSDIVDGILNELLSVHTDEGTVGANLGRIDVATSTRLSSVNTLAQEATTLAIKVLTDRLSAMLETVGYDRFKAEALEEAPANDVDMTGATVVIDEAVLHNAFDTYVPNPIEGASPPIIAPGTTDSIRIYMHCYDTDSNTPLENVTAYVQLLNRPTVYNTKGHNVRQFEGVYSAGVWYADVPPDSKLRVVIEELGVDRTGFVGSTGGITIRADQLLLELPEVI